MKTKLTGKLRFFSTADHENLHILTVKARQKANGKWTAVGTCHAAAKQEILNGNLELINWYGKQS